VFSVEENIVKENPMVLHGAMCAEHVAKRITSRLNAKQKRYSRSKSKKTHPVRREFLFCVTTKPAMTETVNSVLEWEIYAQMLINEKPVRFHIDCGATLNVLPSKFVNQGNIQPTKRVLQMWNKTKLKPEGTCCVTIIMQS